MLKIYFKQAIELLKQHKLFSGIYIFGTALAIASTTIMVVVAYLDIAPLYPDVNRENVYYVKHLCVKRTDEKGMSVSNYSYKAVEEWFYKLKNKKEVSAEYGFIGRTSVKTAKTKAGLYGRYTDPAFFRIYQFNFIKGRPFTQSEFDGKLKRAVISDEAAKALFGSVNGAMEKPITVRNKEYIVCGVYEEPSMIMSESFAGVILPYTTADGYDEADAVFPCLGQYKFRILIENETQADALRREIAELMRQYNSVNTEFEISLGYTDLESSVVIDSKGLSTFYSSTSCKIIFAVIFILLLVPALNLSGLISGRMSMRSLELGVRKSFGATRGKLLRQVMWENLFLTLLGGVIGFILSWVFIYCCKDWLFMMILPELEEMSGTSNVKLTIEMIFSPIVFLFSFLACVVLNVMSAYIPARNALKCPIVESLNAKNN